MIGPRALILLFVLFGFALLAAAAPIPFAEGTPAKKELKQYKVKRGETPTRVGRDAAKPSGYVKRDAPKPSQYAYSLRSLPFFLFFIFTVTN
ncbi:hypothetical protein DFH08DRAFT_133681 [Mycena albidolilacea]|uniref:Uncharacterized protein n=1 Tax=Mycena albidolilacea TaxID=1033008 RepID=A0AAD7ES89_9AGAR|nr:hypothetical protein DFH08DRAFT_133681 [Mycena albidolilacea]